MPRSLIEIETEMQGIKARITAAKEAAGVDSTGIIPEMPPEVLALKADLRVLAAEHNEVSGGD